MFAGRAQRGLSLALGSAGLLLVAGFAFASGAQWRQAEPGYEIAFARDHASHPDYKIEWWYYTGNLAARDGRRYGYQLTFFRIGVDPAPANPSRWAVRDLFMAHLAMTDIDGGRFQFAERLNRAGVGWAGASADRYRVWNEDWSAEVDSEGRHVLRAAEGEIGVDLVLDEGKPPVAHGERGLSRKGSQPGNASHYYSLTRMPARGAIVAGGERVEVEGPSWMDHEFGTGFLEAEQVGWDWFSIQLDDGTDLMLFQVRRSDGSRDPHSSGALVPPSGAATPVRLGEFVLEPDRRWRSPESGAEYPVEWRLALPGRAMDVRIRAAVDDQELRTSECAGVTYWEGSVIIEGSHEGRPVQGRGYLEMTGYAGPSMGTFLQ